MNGAIRFFRVEIFDYRTDVASLKLILKNNFSGYFENHAFILFLSYGPLN